ncbi:FmdB family zinc ribbon protein [Streptomyces sp. RGM 3693]|uniref:FmdB family zinc ribbon protein n=1 Tax=Streptomyces sp. RGM 3693 TaxID=3413284 RepID=UPI003D2D04FF
MPRYEYRCRPCGTTFELNRPMAESSAPASCPEGHQDTVKLLSTVAVMGSPLVERSRELGEGTASTPGPSAAPRGGGGGCCGGGCCG